MSLREALYAVNQAGTTGVDYPTGPGLGIDDSAGWSSNQITFNFGGTPRTIELSSANGGGLAISESVDIIGPGPDKLSIDASLSSTGIRIFLIESAGNDLDVSISGMRLTGGDVAGSGGAIFANATQSADDVSVTLSEIVFDKNVATENGGGLAILDSTALLESLTFTQNDAHTGGGLSFESARGAISFEVNGSVFDCNTALYGGGASVRLSGYTGDADLRLTRNVFSRNEAKVSGGGLFVDSSLNITDLATPNVLFEISDSTINDNRALGTDARPYLDPNQAWPNDVDANVYGGGGIHFTRWETSTEVSQSEGIEFRLTNSTISHNFAKSGGGLSIQGGLDIAHCTIVRNEAGHYADDDTLITSTTITENIGKRRVESTAGGGVLIRAYDALHTPENHGLLYWSYIGLPSFSHTILARNRHILLHEGDPNYRHYVRRSPNLGITYERSGQSFPGDGIPNAPPFIPEYGYDSDEFVDLHGPMPPTKDATSWPEWIADRQIAIDFSYSIIDDRTGQSEDSVAAEKWYGKQIDFKDDTFIEVPQYSGLPENDPLFLPLQDNGGFKLPDGSTILTHKIVCGSPAWDAGDPSISGEPYFDQRGEHYPRVHISIIDIGAYELGARDFPALAADFDHDGDVDADDLQVWKDNYGNQAFTGGDANDDGKVDHLDLQIWQDHYGHAVTPPNTVHYGDFNGDSFVDGADFIIWQRNFGKISPLQGDANGDGVVDGIDFLIWQRSLGQQSGSECWTDRLQYFAQLQPGKIVVSTLDDIDDGYYGLGELSLREAIYIASQNSGFDEIVFAEELVGTISLTSTIIVGSELWITGPGAEKLSLNAGGLGRVLTVNSGVEATISGMTITGGSVSSIDSGGGILSYGDLTLRDVVITGNTAGAGGAVATYNWYTTPASLRIYNSTIDGNRASTGSGLQVIVSYGGEIVIDGSTISNNVGLGFETATYSEGGGMAVAGDSSSSILITNSTFSGNKAKYSGGLRFHNSQTPTTIRNTTIANNSGGGLDRLGSSVPVQIHNTIVADNVDYLGTTKLDVIGNVASGSTYNLIGSGGSANLSHGTANNIVLTSLQSAGLAPLGNYGGTTKTHALKTGSYAIDKGSDYYTFATDQRGIGFVRDEDMTAVTDGADGYRDIGAFEASTGTTLIVRSDGDRNNSVDLLATTDSLRLREALALATALAGSEIISFDPSLYAGGMATITLSFDGVDAGSAPDSLAVANTVISGPGADKLTIAGTSQQSVFVATGTSTISGVTITGGGGLTGGGIYADGIVTLRDSRVVGNTVSIAGGGIFSYGVLRVIGSEVSDNTVTGASGAGAGIAIEQYNSLYGFDIINSTISGNTASGVSSKGGGLYAYIYDPYLYDYRVINSTITDNSASQGSGVYNTYYQHPAGNGRYLYAGNSMIADNLVGGDVSGNLKTTSANNLLRSGASGGLSTGNTLLSGSATARLKSLEFSSAGTRVHLPYSDSPAIDAGSNSIATSMALEIDQRGWGRFEDWDGVGGETVDIGAVELAFDEIYS